MVTDLERYELKYWKGGHGGPYHGMESALNGAIRHLQGFAHHDNPEAVTVLPYAQWGSNYGTLEVIQIIYANHTCSCPLCNFNGEWFLHIRVVKVNSLTGLTI